MNFLNKYVKTTMMIDSHEKRSIEEAQSRASIATIGIVHGSIKCEYMRYTVVTNNYESTT